MLSFMNCATATGQLTGVSPSQIISGVRLTSSPCLWMPEMHPGTYPVYDPS